MPYFYGSIKGETNQRLFSFFTIADDASEDGSNYKRFGGFNQFLAAAIPMALPIRWHHFDWSLHSENIFHFSRFH